MGFAEGSSANCSRRRVGVNVHPGLAGLVAEGSFVGSGENKSGKRVLNAVMSL
jgi:hypothetical protein